MTDDFERSLRDSLDRHAAGVSQPSAGIDDVYARVDHRRSRRRSVAVLGSVVAVGIGVAGFAALAAGGGDDDPTFGNVEGALGTDGPTTTVAYAIGGGPWSCSGYLGSDGDRDLYADCQPVTGPACAAPTSSMPMTVPTVVERPSSLPEFVTTMPVVDACAIAPTDDVFACAPPTIPPPVATTIAYAEATAPDMTAVPQTACAVTYAEGTAPPTTARSPSTPVVTQHQDALDCRDDQVVEATTTTIITLPISEAEQTYTVVAGDTLIDIARRYGVDPEVLANYNDWADCLDHVILIDDVIKIPPGAYLSP